MAEAACFAVPHASLGEDLAAAVVLHAGSDATEPSLRAYLFDRLSHFKVPSRILVVDVIPKSGIGKVQRRLLAEQLQELLQPASESPVGETERFVADVFREVIPRCPDVGRGGNFFGLGGDSLQAIRAAQRIGARYGIELPAYEIFRHPTPVLLSVRVEELRKQMLLDTLKARFSNLTEEQLGLLMDKRKHTS
ncbi:MAG: hypothetical protein EBZ67_14205 [Chitinophagia bacterium]|nr:hypothetical protein [Chitinophagia bacterium]